MWILLAAMSAWAAVFSGPAEIKVGSDDVLVAWKNTTEAAIVVSAVHVDDAATLQVVPPRLPKTVEPGKSFKFLVVSAGTLAPGFVTVQTSAGEAKLWVNVARGYVPALAGGGETPGATARTSPGLYEPVTTMDDQEKASTAGVSGGFGGPDVVLQVKGPLDDRVVNRVLQGRRAAFEACGSAAREAVVVRFSVAADGSVPLAEVDGAAQAQCLEAALRATGFPSPGAPVTVRWEFELGG